MGYLGLNQQLYDLGLPIDDLFDTAATEVVLSYSTDLNSIKVLMSMAIRVPIFIQNVRVSRYV